MIELLPFLQRSAMTVTVAEATAYVKQLLEDDPTLADLWIRGEVSDPRNYASGHTYFTLRDASSQIKCVLFKQKARGLPPLEHGRQYLVRGAVSVYEANGAYQFYVADHRPLGAGDFYLEFEALKTRLEAEGLFAPERKRPLPRWPARIGVATSAHGAVLHDLRNVLGRRYPLAEIVLAPCQVQGAEAVRTVVASVRALAAAAVDVIVVARGGGSIEDLWAFNDEQVARAIAAATVPVVSAIGHETDFTIADFVADLRAPTPSAAAELVVPDTTALDAEIRHLLERAGRALKAQLWMAGADVDDRATRLRHAFARRLERAERRLGGAEARLATLSPHGVLARGYAVALDAETRTAIRSASATHPGQRLDLLFADGRVPAVVETPGHSTPSLAGRKVEEPTHAHE
jgi:exodeoxyribonuclease VII large subunit